PRQTRLLRVDWPVDSCRTHAAVSAHPRRTGGSGHFDCFVAFAAGGRRDACPPEPAPWPGRSPRSFSSGSFCFFATWAVAWVFGGHHVPNSDELGLFFEFLFWGLGWSCLIWVLNIALEPYVRRRWPATLVSWIRLLAGDFRDPLVGRDVLAGCFLAPFTTAVG